jgi:hypothetical protein
MFPSPYSGRIPFRFQAIDRKKQGMDEVCGHHLVFVEEKIFILYCISIFCVMIS